MKRLLTLAVAAATALTATAAVAQPYGYYGGYADRGWRDGGWRDRDYRYDRDDRDDRRHHRRDHRARRWARGHYLPPAYRSRTYVLYDYGRYGLRRPPRGYYWYRANDDYVLAAIATGLILEVLTGGFDSRGYYGYPYGPRW